MKVDNVKEAREKTYGVADARMYELGKESTERVVKADGTSINIWIEGTKAVKKIPHRVIAHYSEERGNSQFQLRRLATGILNYEKKVAEARHCSQQINPNGEPEQLKADHLALK